MHTKTYTRYFTLPDLAPIMAEAHKLQEEWLSRSKHVDVINKAIGDGLIAQLEHAITALLTVAE